MDTRRTLFYLYRSQSNQHLRDNSLLIQNMITLGYPTSLLVDTVADFEFYKQYAHNSNLQLIAIEKELQKHKSNTIQCNELKIKIVEIRNIQPNRFKSTDELKSYIAKLEDLLTEILSEHDRFFFWTNEYAYRSIEAQVFAYLAKANKKRLNFLMASNIKGRLSNFDSIFFESESWNSKYNQYLANGLTADQRQRFDEFRQEYIDFKQRSFYKIEQNRKSFWSLLYNVQNENYCRGLISFFRERMTRMFTRKVTESNLATIDGPFFLLLLNKENNWLTNIAIPNWKNLEDLIQSIYSSLPKGYHLVIKDHPLISNPNLHRQTIYSFLETHSNVHYIIQRENTEVLAEKSNGIIATVTTASVESLLSGKPILILGNRSVYFPQEKAPIIKIQEIEKIGEGVQALQNYKPNPDHIAAYFLSLLDTSIPRETSKGDFSFSLARDDSFYRRALLYIEKFD